MNWQAIKTHKRSYENPIRAKAGDVLTTAKTDNWQGHTWIWCRHHNGLEGWVAESILEMRNGEATLLENFNAIELSVLEGDVLQGSRRLGGWLWASHTEGDSGWVPLSCLEEVCEEVNHV